MNIRGIKAIVVRNPLIFAISWAQVCTVYIVIAYQMLHLEKRYLSKSTPTDRGVRGIVLNV